MDDSAVLVFLSLSLMSWRSASRSLPSGFSSFEATHKMMMQYDLITQDTVKHKHIIRR